MDPFQVIEEGPRPRHPPKRQGKDLSANHHQLYEYNPSSSDKIDPCRETEAEVKFAYMLANNDRFTCMARAIQIHTKALKQFINEATKVDADSCNLSMRLVAEEFVQRSLSVVSYIEPQKFECVTENIVLFEEFATKLGKVYHRTYKDSDRSDYAQMTAMLASWDERFSCLLRSHTEPHVTMAGGVFTGVHKLAILGGNFTTSITHLVGGSRAEDDSQAIQLLLRIQYIQTGVLF